jgi:hypothetical protein
MKDKKKKKKRTFKRLVWKIKIPPKVNVLSPSLRLPCHETALAFTLTCIIQTLPIESVPFHALFHFQRAHQTIPFPPT